MGFVDPIDEDDNPVVAEGGEDGLELAQEFVSLLAAGLGGGGEGLAAEFAEGRNQSNSQRRAEGSRLRTLRALRISRGVPLGAGEPPAPIEPADEDETEHVGGDPPAPEAREGGEEGGDDDRHADADLKIAAAP